MAAPRSILVFCSPRRAGDRNGGPRGTEQLVAADGAVAGPGHAERYPGVEVSWASHSPFTPADIGAGAEEDPPTAALGRLYLPPGTHPPRSVPAVMLLHGSGGVLPRELTYAPQLARMGSRRSSSIRSARGAIAAPRFSTGYSTLPRR